MGFMLKTDPALKERHNEGWKTFLFRPYRARHWGLSVFPGRCPGLACCAPL